MRLNGKLTVLVTTGVVVLGVISTISSVVALRKAGERQIAETRVQMLETKREKLQDLVRNAYAVLEKAHDDALDPERVAERFKGRLKDVVDLAYTAIEAAHNAPDLSEKQKKAKAMNVVRNLRYGPEGKDYLWINDTQPAMVMHPYKPQLDGKDLSGFKDPNGKKLFVEFARVCEDQGQGFVDYMWPKPGHEDPVAKISYVRLFEPWGWIVGSGVYMEAAEGRIQEDAKQAIAALRYGPEGKDYFWINDTQPAMVMHPIKPQLDGKDLSEFEDPTGKKLFVEFVRTCKEQGEGFVDYMWPKPGSEQDVPKLSFVKLFEPWGWIVGTGVYTDDVEVHLATLEGAIRADISSQVWAQIGLATVITALVTLLGWLMSKKIVQPIERATGMLKDIAEGEGDLTARLEVSSDDEIGEMATWFNTFVGNIQSMISDIAVHSGNLEGSSTQLSGLSGQMSQGSDQMLSRSGTVAAASEQMSGNMTSVAAAVEQATTNLELVATASEEMTATIREIAQNTERASDITSEAVMVTQSASGRVDELGEAAEKIGKVTATINEISEQTKLLALNATIEAARAGDAGKGFAVVANEIKELARQTAAATEEIRERVEGIQSTTAGTVQEIGQISGVIGDVNEIVTTIASAVEEQSITTREIANNVYEASQGVKEVNTNVAETSTVSGNIAREIADVNQAAREISDSSSQVSMSADEMSGMASQLREMVARFKV